MDQATGRPQKSSSGEVARVAAEIKQHVGRLVAEALNLSHGDGCGRSFYTRRTTQWMTSSLQLHPDAGSLARCKRWDGIQRLEDDLPEEEEKTASVQLEAGIAELVARMLRRLLTTDVSAVRQVEGAAAVLGAGAVLLETLAATTGESPRGEAAEWRASRHELLALLEKAVHRAGR